MAGARWAALAVVGAIALCIGGCGDDKGTDVSAIAIVTPGARDDAMWTQRTVAAVRSVAKRVRAKAIVVDGSTGDVAATLERVAKQAQLIVVPYGGDRATAVRLAAEHEVATLVWGDPGALKPDLVGDVEVDWRGGAFAAGTQAIEGSYFRSAGAVVCQDATKVDLAQRYGMAAAFLAGARDHIAKAKVAYALAGADGRTTPDEARSAVKRLARGGTQMVFGVCGAAADGAYRGSVDAGGETLYVDLVGQRGPITGDYENNIVASIMLDPAPALAQAVRDVRAGRFGTRTYPLDFANDGLSLLSTGRTPGNATEAGEAAAKRVAEGGVELPDVSSEQELRDYVEQLGG